MNKITLAPIVSLLLSSCATSKNLNPGAAVVKVGKSDPMTSCKEVGQMRGGGDPTSRRNDLKNEAFEKAANYVRLESTYGAVENGTAH